MHGTELCNQDGRVLSLSAPRCLRWKATFQCLQAHRPAFLTGADNSKRPFARPKRLSVSGPPFQGQSSRPTSSLPCQMFVKPVRFSIPLRTPVRPGARRIPTKNPLPDSRLTIPTVPRISTPLWGPFEPFRIKAFNPIPSRKAHLPKTPDDLSLPNSGSILLAPEPDHRSRLAAISAACCSTDLLEPQSSCTQGLVTVK